MNISVVLPSYKEAENLKILLPQIKENLDKLNIKSEIIVIDAMKEIDDTKKICIENKVKYINRRNSDSYGDAVRTGIKSAKNDYLLIMDADCSHSPADLYKLIQECDKNDIVIGSRYIKNGKTENNILLIFMSWIVNFVYRVCFKIKVKDLSTSFRIYRTNDIKEIKLESDNFEIVEEILIKLCLKNKNYKIKEVPVTMHNRKEGQSKRKLWVFTLSYISEIKKLLKMKNKIEKR